MSKTDVISYEKAEGIVRKHLKSIKNLKEFCDENKLSYQYCSRIRTENTKGTVYSNLIYRILNILGYEVKMKVEKKISYIKNSIHP